MPDIFVKDYNTTVSFPDDTPDDIIKQSLSKKFPAMRKDAAPVSSEAGQSPESIKLQQGVNSTNQILPWVGSAITEQAKDIVRTPVSLAKGLYGAAKSDIDYLATPKPVPEAAPEFLKQHPTLYNVASKGLEIVSPTLEMVATAPGAAMANPLLAGLGYSAAKNIERLGKTALGEETVPSVSENLARTVGEIGTGGTMQAVPQGVSGLLNKQTPKSLYETTRSIVPKGTQESLEKQLKQFIQDAKQLGIKTTATEETQSMPIAQVEKQLRNWLGSSGRFRRHDLENIGRLFTLRRQFIDNAGDPNTINQMGETIQHSVDKYLQKAQGITDEKLNILRDNIVKLFGSNEAFDDLGKSGIKAIEEASLLAKSKEHALYENIKNRIPLQSRLQKSGVGALTGETELIPQKLDTTHLQQTAKKILSILDEGEDYAPADLITNLKEYAAGKPVTWNVLEAERRSLRDIGVGINPNLKTLATGTQFGIKPGESQNYRIISELLESIEKDQEVFTKKIGDKTLYEDFLKARSIAKQNREIFKKDIINKIVTSQSPSEIVNYIKTPEDITNVKNAIGEVKFNSIIKSAFTNKIIGAGSLNTFSPQNAENILNSMSKLGTARRIYNEKELWAIKQTIKQGKIDIANKPINHNFLKLLIKERPGGSENIVKEIFRVGDGKSLNRNLLSVYNILDDTGKENLKYHFATELFTRSQPITDETVGRTIPELSGWKGNQFKETIRRYNTSIRKIFSKEDVSLLNKIADVSTGLRGAELLAGNPPGTALTLTTKAQLTALAAALQGTIFGIATGNLPMAAASAGAGVGVIGIPYIMGKAFLSDAGKKWLVRGSKIPAFGGGMTNWLLEGSRLGNLEPVMRENLIRAAELYTVNRYQGNYGRLQMPNAQAVQNVIPQNVGDKTFQSALQELRNRAKNGNTRIKDFFEKQGLGWGI
ncbi:MAG: hypothetical protein [Podoviridae sp. cty5g4]|nr:MAG: hypothetical protein [Podoviridae sp. cty5g4]